MFSGAGDVSPSQPGCSLPTDKYNKGKQILTAPTTTSLRSPAELLSFKTLVSWSKSEPKKLCHEPLQSPSASAIVIGSNEDILAQLFLFLPPKSLVRFQCVSKQWFSLISSRLFRRLHTSQSPTAIPSSTAGLFLFRRIFGSFELNSFSLRDADAKSMGNITRRLFDFLGICGEILSLHSCNGLFCLDLDFHWNNEVRRLCVYNPTTNQYRLVHWPPVIEEKSCEILAINIVFNPLKSDHYKILCLCSELKAELRYSVYSSETGAWKDCVGIEINMNWCLSFKRGVFLNGKLYWPGKSASLFYFDAERDCIRFLWDSCEDMNYGEILYFGESRGNLHLIGAAQLHSDLLDVLEWNGDLEHPGWFVQYRVDLSFLTALYPLMVDKESDPYVSSSKFGVLCFDVEEKGKRAKIVISTPGKIISYEISDMIVEELVEIEPAHLQFLSKNMSWYVWEEAYKHIETLASV